MTMIHTYPSPFPTYGKPSMSIGRSLMKILGTGGKIAALGAVAPLASLAVLGAMDKKDKAVERATRGFDFNKVLDESPSLRSDRALAKKHFRTLRRVAPDLSKDPVLAAGLVKKLNAYADKDDGGVDPSVIQSLLLRPTMDTGKKWEVAARSLPQSKVDVASWEL